MLKPEDLYKEEERLRGIISEAQAKVEEAMASDYWSYTREYQLGKLDTAQKIIQEVRASLERSVLPAVPVTPTLILEAVAAFSGVTVPLLLAKNREDFLVMGRQIAMYLIRQETDLTLEQTGEELGGRSAATVHHGYGRIAGLIVNDGHLRKSVSSIHTIIRGKKNVVYAEGEDRAGPRMTSS